MKIKKLFCFFIAVMLAAFSFCFSAFADFNDEPDIGKRYSYAYYMISLDDGSVIFSKNEDKKVAPAAFNKLVAAVVAIEQWGNLDDKITVTEQSLSLVNYQFGVTTAKIKAGDVYTKRQLLDCLIVYSANDAASVIAYNIAQTKAAFEAKMQEVVKKIGCSDTNIVDMLGFDSDGQYTTAKDITKIIRYALKYPAFSEAFSQSSVTMPKTGDNEERTYRSSNKMTNATIADYYHSAVTGGKQTSTDEAGQCIAATASQDGYSYLVVVMKGQLKDTDKDGVDENTCMVDAKNMLKWAYNNIRFKVVASPGQAVYTVNITAGKGTDTLKLTAEKEVSVLALSKVSSYSVLIEPIAETLPKKVRAPKKAGDVICRARVLYAGKELTTINLVAAEDVGLSMTGFIISTAGAVLMSKPFIAFEIIALLILGAFLALKIYEVKTQKKPKLRVIHGGKSQQKKPPQRKPQSPGQRTPQSRGQNAKRPPAQNRKPVSRQQGNPQRKRSDQNSKPKR